MARRPGWRKPLTAALTTLQVGSQDVTEADRDPESRYVISTPYATTTSVSIAFKTGVTLTGLTFMALPDPPSASAPSYSGTTSSPSGTITWAGGSKATILLTMDVPEIGETQLMLKVLREAQQ